MSTAGRGNNSGGIVYFLICCFIFILSLQYSLLFPILVPFYLSTSVDFLLLLLLWYGTVVLVLSTSSVATYR